MKIQNALCIGAILATMPILLPGADALQEQDALMRTIETLVPQKAPGATGYRSTIAFVRTTEGIKVTLSRPEERLLGQSRRIGNASDSAPLNSDALDFAHADTIVAPIIKARGFSIGMTGHALRDFNPAPVRQVIRDAGGPKGMAANRGFEADIGGAPAHHIPDIRAAHRLV